MEKIYVKYKGPTDSYAHHGKIYEAYCVEGDENRTVYNVLDETGRLSIYPSKLFTRVHNGELITKAP